MADRVGIIKDGSPRAHRHRRRACAGTPPRRFEVADRDPRWTSSASRATGCGCSNPLRCLTSTLEVNGAIGPVLRIAADLDPVGPGCRVRRTSTSSSWASTQRGTRSPVRIDVTRLDLVGRRRAMLGYTLGTALYAFVIVALYPSFEHSTGLDNLTKNSPTIAALFGAVGSLTSPAGWLSVNLYANVLPLLVLLATVGYGASCLAGQDEEGIPRDGGDAADPTPQRHPSRRWRRWVPKRRPSWWWTTAVLAVGHYFDITVSAAHLWGTSSVCSSSASIWGLVAVATGAATGHRGTALGVASGIAAASYLISSMAPVVGWIRPARFASLFYWSVGNNQLNSGLSAGEFGVLVGTGFVLGGVAVAAFERLDLH